MSSPKSTSSPDIALLILRFVLGGTFMAHGIAKLLPSAGGLEAFSEFVGSLPLPLLPPMPLAVLALAAEIGGGALLILGLIPRVAALSLLGVMVVAILFVHGPHGFFLVVRVTEEQMATWPGAAEGVRSIPHGLEYNLALVAMCLQILILGGGRLAIWVPKKGGKK